MFTRIVAAPWRALKWLAFSSVQFSEQEEYLEFRYKFLIVLMLTAAALTGLFILGLVSQMNLIGWAHDDHLCYGHFVVMAAFKGFAQAI